jgi:hypothetical protein
MTLTIDEVIDRERASGVRLGPYERYWLLNQPRVPETVRRNLELANKHPHVIAGKQTYMQMESEGPRSNQTALTATTIEALWSAALYTPIPANSTWEGKTFIIRAGGIMSFAATGSLTITPSLGTATGGNTLGASIARTSPGATTNAPWFLEGTFIIRTIGAAGTMIGTGTFNTNGTATLDVAVAFGGTSGTIDTTAASGITMGKTLSVAGSVTTQYVSFQSAN